MNRQWNLLQSSVDSLVREIGLNSLALANEDGLVIAASGHPTDVEMMAAVSPLLRRGDALVTHYKKELQNQGLGFSVLDVQIEGQSLFLCATGETTQIYHPALKTLLNEAVEALR